VFVYSALVTAELLHDENCKWCGRNLSQSFLAEVSPGIPKSGTVLFPVLCVCGGITVVGAGTFVSHFDQVAGANERKVKHHP
jgi:hypothetical protein